MFCVPIALAVANKGKLSSTAAVISLITISVSVFAGERVNFIIRACGMLAVILEAKITALLYIDGIELAAVAVVFLANDTLASRFGSQFNTLPISENSTFIKIWKGAIIAFQESPIIGIGPDVYRKCALLTQGFELVDVILIRTIITFSCWQRQVSLGWLLAVL